MHLPLRIEFDQGCVCSASANILPRGIVEAYALFRDGPIGSSIEENSDDDDDDGLTLVTDMTIGWKAATCEQSIASNTNIISPELVFIILLVNESEN
jgi:hypothetical protein